MKKIIDFIAKHPVWIVVSVLTLVVVALIGATDVNIATGNQTLVKKSTDTFQDNEDYQNQFGGETIILQIEPTDKLFTNDLIKTFDDIEYNLNNLDGVFSYQSPASIVKNVTNQQLVKFVDGIEQVGTGLSDISLLLNQQATSLAGFDVSQIEAASLNITTALGDLGTAQMNLENQLVFLKIQLGEVNTVLEQLETDLLSDGVTNDDQTLVQYSQQLTQLTDNMGDLINMITQLETITTNTTTGLTTLETQLTVLFDTLLTQLSEMNSFTDQLVVLSTQMGTMSDSLLMIVENSDILRSGIPTKQTTLDNIVYEGENRRSIFDAFVVNDKYVMMQISLNGDVTKEQKELIIEEIEEVLADSEYEESYLLSGKAVLDLSIQNSMVESMKKMLMLSLGLMILIMIITFKVRWRILPLVTVLIALIATIGLMGYLTIPVTMVSMAVFPILIGLGIDYAIQFQNHYSLVLAEEEDYE
ncbi:MAG: MMPL family transporter [Candidatus Izimaplasma sp.]|nr:MMPL family transporter [Candidatus Izimaplasma bacterium]